jgi:uncharacterized membrane protein YdjX (TVP38/TMEM64 family)
MCMQDSYRINLRQNFWKSLVAIIVGNAIYFLLLSPNLPPSGRHRVNSIDLGLVIDFWVCLVVYGVIELVLRRKKQRKAAE